MKEVILDKSGNWVEYENPLTQIKDSCFKEYSTSFNQRDFCHLYGHMWVNVHTCEKMLVIDDDAYSLEGLCGRKVFLPQNKVEELCWIEDHVNNYLEY